MSKNELGRCKVKIVLNCFISIDDTKVKLISTMDVITFENRKNRVTIKMERRRYLWVEFFWIAVLIQLAMFTTTATNVTILVTGGNTTNDSPESGYAWSSWGSWSACSRTCGGGVSHQERQCLPRVRTTIPEGTLPPPVIAGQAGCTGVARRYHECNTAPCPGGTKDIRLEQCAAYDRRPFRGKFFTWVPYVDGDFPCILNCRPLGHRFYASLALVDDGTPCTKPGVRAICVQGNCQEVGMESILAVTNTGELRCGQHLVSGLFNRPRLPLGYSYVTTVPRGACRLNISEIIPSENYIALKITNESYIINGEFAVSSPGIYEAAGARFLYSRSSGLDSIFALGPIQSPIDIMVLYTKPSPSIKYEYFTESLLGEIDTETTTRPYFPEVLSTAQMKHLRRQHSFDAHPLPTVNVTRYQDFTSVSDEEMSDEDMEENFIGGRIFTWKILSYTQCSRSCGGGIQVGKYRCVESNPNNDKEVSPVHCSGSAPAARRRRCGNAPCPPRWRSTPWTSCPKCGPANRTRIVGCAQDHSRGITKISDQKCPAPKPPTTETCDIPDCKSYPSDVYIGSRRVSRPPITDTFRAGPVYTIIVNDTESNVGPEYTFSAAAGWLYTDWSECTGWCVGGGIQTREVRCADPSGCAPRKSPDVSKTCTPKLTCDLYAEGQWFTGDWSSCSSPCRGKQVRGVLCIGGTGRYLTESACRSPKPEHERDCSGDCKAMWYYSEWGPCIGKCSLGTGRQRRTVWCAKPDSASEELECGSAKPPSQRVCELHCASIAVSTRPLDLPIESQKITSFEKTSTQRSTVVEIQQSEDCEDKLRNCALAVQARLCHYNYYKQKCCVSCKGHGR